ncbi:MAG TPA: hypothetical protein VNO30_08895 [Kofleriaceae bacterium]|nr:hypothetical protein [Kofleriaceae bacterium]
MSYLSSAAWIAHDLGLATTIGGTLFGQGALQPALNERLGDDQERKMVADAAWRKFTWMNLAAHTVFAATWFAGRTMLSGREVSQTSRVLTKVKDGLVIASLATGVATAIVGRVLGKKVRDREVAQQDSRFGGSVSSAEPADAGTDASIERLRKVVGTLGKLNLLATAGIGAVTTALSMEAGKSLPFSFVSRTLP